MTESPTCFDDLRIEVATLRLVMRAMLTYLACADTKMSGDALATISAMLEGTGSQTVIADDIGNDLRQAAIARARTRMVSFMTDIQRLPIA